MSQPNSNRPLPEQVKALEHLQELDLKIDQLQKSKSALPGTLKSLDQNVQKQSATVTIKRTALGEIEKVQRQTQAALDLNRDRLTRSNTRLEGVQNSQEFQAIQKELDQLRKLTSTLEEQSKKSNADAEVIKKELADLDAQVAKIKGDRDSQADALQSQGSDLEGQINALLGERKQHSVKVEPRTLAQYDRVRVARAGIGIAPAVGGRCRACNMMVPPQLFNEIRKGLAIHSCPSCHRLLFAAETAEGTTGQPSATQS